MKPPLVLLHGITMSGRAWDEVIPLLDERFEVFAPTALGHRGGDPSASHPVRVEHLIDHAEGQLDERGWQRPHIAGNSLGGWMAVELARRGRAASVCAISPAGFWDAGTPSQRRAARRLDVMARAARLAKPIAPIVMRIPAVRAMALSDVSAHPVRVRSGKATAAQLDVCGCTARKELLFSDEEIAPLDPLPCPVSLAWAERDRVLPLRVNGEIARERLPGAAFSVLPDVGHVPMLDDPALVARTIAESVAEASAGA